MLVIVPAEKGLEPTTRVKQGGEEARVVWLVLERLELRLTEGVVVRDVRSAEALVDSERCEKLRERVALHRSASVSVHDETRLGRRHRVLASVFLGTLIAGALLFGVARSHSLAEC